MEPTGPTVATKDFHDQFNGSATSFVRLLGPLFCVGFFTSVWWWSNNKFFLLLSCVVVPTMLLAFPRWIRSAFLACRGAPALRINENGIWSRQWSSLGWIGWRDITSAECLRAQTGRELIIHLRSEKFARLAGHDQVSVMLARLTGFLFFIDAGPNTIRLMNSRTIACSWEDLMATLAPILAANGVPLLEKLEST